MKTNKKRIVLSALSLVLVFCLLAGGTMAWFTDTEKVAGNFSAGVLDIEVNPGDDGFTTTEPMEFKNLRPMLLKNFDKELVESGDVNNLENNGQDPDNYPQDNLPIYFRPVHIENKGTLPIYIHLGMEATGSDDKEPVLYGDDKFNINQDLYEDKDCENTLKDALKIFVYKQVKNSEDPSQYTWERVKGVNLNEITNRNGERKCYDPTDVIGAGEDVTYIIGGYLPSQTGNEYQGMHYHGKLVVDAQQADQGPFKHGDGGEEPENITVNVPVKILDQSDASNPKFLEDVEIPMTFDLGTEVADSEEIVAYLKAFLETYEHDGQKYEYYGRVPDQFDIVYNEETGEYEADLHGAEFMTLHVLPIK